ncbi:FecR family protein [Chitinophaga sp. CB10]|uniref:FecR family protein n=1 Tax=Chitinophaga sp. CB10 TaxID=1891659 RepID=UPI0025C12BA1|nr:FecR domain-containing protein [Chitinophaga sp. CB10]
MDTPDQDINWDKILAALEDADTSQLTEAEKSMYLAAMEMKQLAKAEERFPTEEGWQRFVAARDQRTLKVRWRKRLAVAASLTVLLGAAGAWWKLQHTNTAKKPAALAQAILPPTAGVQIKTGNGLSVALDSAGKTARLANGVTVQLSSANVIQYNAGNTQTVLMDTLLVPRGNKAHIVLADGSHVWLNAASKLVYPTIFAGPVRSVAVEGEAYFDVAPNAQQPFEVEVRDVRITVLGTAFNVNNYHAAVQTTLVSGKVSAAANGQTIVLAPGQQSQYDSRTGQQQRTNVDTRIYTAWKEGDIYFEEAALGDILQSLGRSFDYTFSCQEPALTQLQLTLDMRQPANLQQVLDHISLITGNIQFRIQGRNIEVLRK